MSALRNTMDFSGYDIFTILRDDMKYKSLNLSAYTCIMKFIYSFDTRAKNAILRPWCETAKMIVSTIDDESV